MSNQAFASELETGIGPLVIETPCRALIGKVKRALCPGSLLLILLLTTGCASKTLFQSNFDATPVNQSPAHQQAVGTVTVEGGVVVSPIPDTNSKAARFSRVTGSNVAVLHCDLTGCRGWHLCILDCSILPQGSRRAGDDSVRKGRWRGAFPAS